MPRTAEKVRDLLREDPEMEDAIEVVLAEADDGTVEWGDVREDITSGQWGRLIEKGLLEDAASGDGFRLEDPARIREALEDPGDIDYDTELPDKDVSWSQRDKLAGLLTLALVPAYWIGSVRGAVAGAVDVLFAPLAAVMPFYAVILVLAVLTGLYSALLQDNLMDSDVIAAYQSRMQEVQDMQKEARESGDKEAMEQAREQQAEAISENTGMFKEQFRPFVYIMLLTIPVFVWMYWKLPQLNGAGSMVLPLLGETGINEGAIGPMPAWLLWYFLCSLGFSNVIRKTLNVQTSPTSS